MIKRDTEIELQVKAKLDELGVRYEHSYNLNGRFFVDFYLPDFNTIIEVDGCYWHKCVKCGYEGRPRDQARNAYIQACGYRLEIIREHELHAIDNSSCIGL